MTHKQSTERMAVFTAAHHDYEKGLNALAFFKIGNSTVGEGLVQDTFIKTWQYLLKGGKIEVMRSFLYHILNNLIIDEYRKHKTISLEVLLEKGFEPSSKDFNRIFDVIDGKVALLLIQDLSPIYRKIMNMRYVEELSIKEMSLLIGQSNNTTTVQVHRGLEKLKLLYGNSLTKKM